MLSEKNPVLDKKGLSPLIATVLLIGFALAIAVLIILWGQGFLRQLVEKTGDTGEQKLSCESDVKIDVEKAVCNAAGRVVVTIQNQKDKIVPNFRGKIIGETGAVSSLAGSPLNANDRKQLVFVYDASTLTNPERIEVVPIIYSGKNQIPCESRKQEIKIDRSNC